MNKKIVCFHLQFIERQIVAQDSCTFHSVNNDLAQQWWNIFHKLSDVFYDQLIQWIIDQSKKTLHDIKDHWYKCYECIKINKTEQGWSSNQFTVHVSKFFA